MRALPLSEGAVYTRRNQSGHLWQMRESWATLRLHAAAEAEAAQEDRYEGRGAGEGDEDDADDAEAEAG